MNAVHALALPAFVWSLAVGAAEPVVMFEDGFEGALQPGWTWLREEPGWWCVRDGGLEIRNRPGDAQSVVNALLRPAPDRAGGKYAVEVTVHHHRAPIEQYEQAGITLYNDGKPVFKLVKELVDGELMIIPGRKPMDRQAVRLRLIVDRDRYVAQFRPEDESEFQTAATGELPAPANDRISLQCYHGPAREEHWIRFDDFRIVRLPEQ